MKGIAGKMMALFSAILVICLAVLVTISYTLTREPLISAIGSEASRLASGTAQRLDSWMAGRTAEIRAMAASRDVRSMDWVQAKPYLVDATSGASQATNFHSVWLADLNGQAIDTTNNRLDLSQQPAFREAISGKAPITGQPTVLGSSGQLVVPVVCPVTDADGQPVGAIGGSIEMDQINELINLTKISPGSYAFLINKAGTIISHPQASLLNTPLARGGGSDLKAIAARMMAGDSGHGVYRAADSQRDLFFVPVASTNWSLGLSVDYDELLTPITDLRHKLMVASAAMMVVAALLTFWVSTVMAKPLRGMAAISLRLAEGDLGVRMDSRGRRDEVGILARNFDAMANRLAATVAKIRSTTVNVRSVADLLNNEADQSRQMSGQVSAALTDLAQNTSENAAQTESGVEILHQLAGAIEQVAISSQQTAMSTEAVERAIQQGTAAITEQNDVMTRSSQASHEISAAVKTIANYSQQIHGIVDGIKRIAKQTNLLALNAAIEAANAGEHGRGFAVVANEVRRLAEQSNREVEKISEVTATIVALIDQAHQQIGVVEDSVEEQTLSLAKTNDSFTLVGDATQRIVMAVHDEAALAEEMLASTNDVVESIQSISSRSEEAAAAVQSVAAAMQQQAATSEKLRSTANQLLMQLKELEESVGHFRC